MHLCSAVLPLLLCMAVGLNQVRAEVQAVKLCGREFLRAVVYTCGGSRWRRLLSEPDQPEAIGEQPLGSMEDLKANLGLDFSRRDNRNMLTTVCCQVGCRKTDLTYLC
ncbi:hypothetical protein DPEC_G00338660 [Dallia pectoralis]|uniref:Uncharacterized protein n=1 Tax=Dallia pectoralis TaxID=75939 RepID=A0ACC2F4M3_DALPE|nr:hypothetical protein DPEC_G00338660 [Dallia pectoralis]